MNSRFGRIIANAAVAVAAGVLLRYAVGLRPVWWLVWIAPVPLLVVAIRVRPQDARWMVSLAVLIGVSCDFDYFRLVMPLPAVIASITAETLVWGFLIFATRRVVVRYQEWWTVFVYPALSVTVDTLMAAFLPDGNWGSLAYSQADQLPIIQVAALFGTSGLLFLITLVPSTLALAIAYGRSLRRGWIAYTLTAVLVASSLLYGWLRLQKPVRGVETTFGMVSIDDPIGLRSSAARVANIVQEYDRRVEALAAQGAQVVVLPEKIAMIAPAAAGNWQQRVGAMARRNHVWLEVSIGIDDGKSPLNWAWLFSPEGALAVRYQKHHLAPPERRDHYAIGTDYSVETIAGKNYGLAICKDMHFAAFGRAYGQRHVAVMLVPAWDFDYLDGWMAARMTAVRGIESGYAVVRASREGLLTASDGYGRILAEAPSSAMPGSSLPAKLAVADPIPTLYTRIGNLFGWLCVAATAVFLLLGRRRAPRRV